MSSRSPKTNFSSSNISPVFYLPEDLDYTIFDSAKDSVNFAVNHGLSEYKGQKSLKSCFVDVEGDSQLWHPFGVVEGVGWGANTVGASHELFRYSRFVNDQQIGEVAVSLLDHALDGGFMNYKTGLITPYRDTRTDSFYLNYLNNNDWFAAGSMAKVAHQLLVYSDEEVGDERKKKMQDMACKNIKWLNSNIEVCSNGWYARRNTINGDMYTITHDGRDVFGRGQNTPDIVLEISADGLFIIELMTELTKRGLADYTKEIREKVGTFMKDGGIYGSINHDTYDNEENVSYAVAFRTLREAGNLLGDEEIKEFAYKNSLAGLVKFEMREDRNGVATKGLLYMERSWDMATLWENVEASAAYLEAYQETKDESYLIKGLTILRAIAKHHHGERGFLSEGIDWSGSLGPEHHVGGVINGDTRYTQPFLNNLHIVGPTLFYLEDLSNKKSVPGSGECEYYDFENNLIVSIPIPKRKYKVKK